MKKATTIITEISKLEHELYRNYTPQEIKEAIEKCEENHTIPITCDDLVSVIYEDVTDQIKLEEFINNKEDD